MKLLCSICEKRPAVFRRRGQHGRKARRDHDICRQCWQAIMDRERKPR